jgi:vacuolar protein sorting-associated protein 18
MAFLNQTEGLVKIEDILKFFRPFVLIDDFKEEICAALEEYNRRITELKSEMDAATRSADELRLDIKNLRNK